MIPYGNKDKETPPRFRVPPYIQEHAKKEIKHPPYDGKHRDEPKKDTGK